MPGATTAPYTCDLPTSVLGLGLGVVFSCVLVRVRGGSFYSMCINRSLLQIRHH